MSQKGTLVSLIFIAAHLSFKSINSVPTVPDFLTTGNKTKQTKVAGSRECKNLGGSGFALVFLSFDFSQRCTAMESLRTQPEVPRRNTVPTRGGDAPGLGTSRSDFTYLLHESSWKEYTCKSVAEPPNGNSGCGGKLND